jgi:hypothetical protein
MLGASERVGAHRAGLVLALTLASAGCGSGPDPGVSGPSSVLEAGAAAGVVDPSGAAADPACEGAAFERTYDSPEAVARAFLEALAANDLAQLEALALDEREFRCLVWSQLPASRPGTNLTVDYVWNDLRFKSLHYLAWTRQSYGGERLRLHDLRFAGATTDYGSFVVRRDTLLRVTDELGRTGELQLFGSMIEAGGRYKLWSFVRD